jgi:hypothetical protein
MFRRTGSTISSPLFLSGTDSSKEGARSRSVESTFIPKGEESTFSISSFSVPSTPHSSAPDPPDASAEELQFNTKDGPFKLNRDTLRATLNDLKAHGSTLISKLPKTQASIFKNIVDIMGVVYDTQGLYDIVLSDIRSVFTNTENVRPGTLEAFLIGCANDDKFTGPMGCNPKCAAGLPPPDGTPGYTQCEDMVLIYGDGNFSALNEQVSTHTYIYVDGPDFKGFSSENIRSLREANISQVTLLYGGPNGSYTEVTPKLSLEQLPSTSTVKSSDVNATQTNSTTVNGAGVALVIILIIIIILLLIALWARYAGYY